MTYIVRSVKEWEYLFNIIIKLKIENKQVIMDTITYLERFNKGLLTPINDYYKLINAFLEIRITDVLMMLQILKVLNSYYCYQSILDNIKKLNTKYGVDSLAFISSGDNLREIETYFSLAKKVRLFLPKENYSYAYYDLKTNGVDKLIFRTEYPFIVDYEDLNNKKKKRIMFTNSFNLNCLSLPLKEEIDLACIKMDKDELFKGLIDFLAGLDIEKKIVISNPNGEYEQSRDLTKDYKLRCDGVILDQDEMMLTPSKEDYLFTEKLLIKNANFMVISKLGDNKIKEVVLVIEPNYYNKMICNKEIEKILALFIKEERNVYSLLLSKSFC